MIRVAVLGYGYWGPNLVRNLWEHPECRVAVLADTDPARRSQAARRYPTIEMVADPTAALDSTDIDAVVIATPVMTHFDLARRALANGKHVLVEKPLTATSLQAAELVEEAQKRGLVLMVDHTFLYSPAVRRLKELVADGSLGDVYYYDAVRFSLGPFKRDQNVIWDLAIHDLSILDYVLPGRPTAVSATGMSHAHGGLQSVAYVAIHFDTRLIAHAAVNWLAPVKMRQTLIGGSRRMILYDDVQPSEKLKVYDRGISAGEQAKPEEVYRLLRGHRTGDMWAPQIDLDEPLRGVVEEFIRCVHDGSRPLSDGHTGLRLVRTLEAATESMRTRGQPVDLGISAILQ
jgi:predicted dehydrogenase